MGKKKIAGKSKLDLSINDLGTVVVTADKSVIDNFVRVANLEIQAHNILIGCVERKQRIWKDVMEKYNLPEDFHYNVDHITGDITLVGKRR